MNVMGVKQGQKMAFTSFSSHFDHEELKVGELAKTLSAMANTLGGKVLIGVCVGPKKNIMIEDTPVDLPNLETWKDEIQSFLMPELPNLYLKWKDGLIEITILASDQKPHMFSNYRYYKRSKSKNVVMEEFEIRQLYQIGKQADLQITGLSNLQGVPIMSLGLVDTMKFYPRVYIQNLGQKVETLYKLELKVPSALIDEQFSVLHSYLKGYEKDYNIYEFPSKSALFQGEKRMIAELVLKVNAENYTVFENGKLFLKLYSQNKVHTQEFYCNQWFHYKGSLPDKKTFLKKIAQ